MRQQIEWFGLVSTAQQRSEEEIEALTQRTLAHRVPIGSLRVTAEQWLRDVGKQHGGALNGMPVDVVEFDANATRIDCVCDDGALVEVWAEITRVVHVESVTRRFIAYTGEKRETPEQRRESESSADTFRRARAASSKHESSGDDCDVLVATGLTSVAIVLDSEGKGYVAVQRLTLRDGQRDVVTLGRIGIDAESTADRLLLLDLSMRERAARNAQHAQLSRDAERTLRAPDADARADSDEEVRQIVDARTVFNKANDLPSAGGS